MPRSSGRSSSLIWLVAFALLPLGVWFGASRASGFGGKRISNLSLEPAVVLIGSCSVYLMWFLVAREGLKPLTGVVLLILAALGAFAVQRLVPGLRE